MRSKLLKILIAVFAVCLMTPAFSAVENVKVGGDIVVYHLTRKFDVNTTRFFQAHVRVYVSADLSENVSTMIRLAKEFNLGENIATPVSDIVLDLAYVKVSDFLAPGLTITAGRQEIQLGEGLVIGSRYNVKDYPYDIGATDLGILKAFDAIRIDYAPSALPMNLTLFGAKITENPTGTTPDSNLIGADIGLKLADVVNMDIYFIREAADDINTIGGRIVAGLPAVEGLSLKAEYAKQTQNSKGWALLAGMEYKMSAAMEPVIKVNYARFTEDYEDVYPSNIDSRIGPVLYATGLYGQKDLQSVNLGFGFSPIEKVGISIDGYWGRVISDKQNLGIEVDLGVDWKYTEDLTLGVTGGKIFGRTGTLVANDPWQVIVYGKVAF